MACGLVWLWWGSRHRRRNAPLSPRVEPLPSTHERGSDFHTPTKTRQRPVPADVPEGDWVFDGDTEMFWSQSKRIYMDPETKRVYDSEWHSVSA
jgi:hypothetical protein